MKLRLRETGALFLYLTERGEYLDQKAEAIC